MWPRKDVQRNFFIPPLSLLTHSWVEFPAGTKVWAFNLLALIQMMPRKKLKLKENPWMLATTTTTTKKCDILPFTRWEKWRLAWEKNRFSWNNNWDWFDVLNYQTHRAKTLLRNSCVSEGWFEREREKAHLIFFFFFKVNFSNIPPFKDSFGGSHGGFFFPISLPSILTPCFKIISKYILANKINKKNLPMPQRAVCRNSSHFMPSKEGFDKCWSTRSGQVAGKGLFVQLGGVSEGLGSTERL